MATITILSLPISNFVLNILTLPEFLISNGTMLHTLEVKYLGEFVSIYTNTGKVGLSPKVVVNISSLKNVVHFIV